MQSPCSCCHSFPALLVVGISNGIEDWLTDGGPWQSKTQVSRLKTRADRKRLERRKDWKDRKSGELSGSPGPGGKTGGAQCWSASCRYPVVSLAGLHDIFRPQSNRYTTTLARNSPVRDWNFRKNRIIWQQNESRRVARRYPHHHFNHITISCVTL